VDGAAVHVQQYVQVLESVEVYHCLGRLALGCSHSWFATVQEVLHADWQEAWHSPQPFAAVSLSAPLLIVFICFTAFPSLSIMR
jgi:hypothetical protein